MRKLLYILILIGLVLSGCTEKVTVPDFTTMTFTEAVQWSKDNDVEFDYEYVYNNSVEKNDIFKQDIEPGTVVEEGLRILITYSKGYDPYTEIELPDFNGMGLDEITLWLEESHITNYRFEENFNALKAGSLVSYEIQKKEERDYYIIGDKFVFSFSKGELMKEEVVFEANKWRGVNLGGWFVLEGWMTPELFSGVSGSDETVFLQQKENAEALIKEHWETFITEDDFIWLKDKGIDYVRIPIPWWLYGVHAYEGSPEEVTYIRSVEYIHKAMSWADEHGINVLLDLHTAPGGQNGFDNGGLTDIQEWGKRESETHYIETTVDVLEQITIDFSVYESLWGIEVLNEPSWGVRMSTLQDFYMDAYSVIREHNTDVWIGMHDGFRSYETTKWIPFFEQDLEKVFFDMHIYSVFTDEISSYTVQEHMDYVSNVHGNAISNYEGVVPVVIGEWSYALPGTAFEGSDSTERALIIEAYGNRQLNVYGQAQGWFFWNYRIDRDSHLEWDFRRLYESGVTPSNYLGE